MMAYFWNILAITLAFTLGFIARGYFRIALRKRGEPLLKKPKN
jgi:hypothetical protein